MAGGLLLSKKFSFFASFFLSWFVGPGRRLADDGKRREVLQHERRGSFVLWPEACFLFEDVSLFASFSLCGRFARIQGWRIFRFLNSPPKIGARVTRCGRQSPEKIGLSCRRELKNWGAGHEVRSTVPRKLGRGSRGALSWRSKIIY